MGVLDEMLRTQRIEDLKANWSADPCWDIEDTPGFEDRRDELAAYRHEMEEKWERQRQEAIDHKAEALGCPGNSALAQYVMALEKRIEVLEDAKGW